MTTQGEKNCNRSFSCTEADLFLSPPNATYFEEAYKIKSLGELNESMLILMSQT